jgi:hypothetical protein
VRRLPLSKVPTIVLLHSASSRERYLWERTAEDFVAMRTATSISHVTGQIRLFMNYALSAALLLVCAVMSYPFQPERFLSVMTWSLVLVVVGSSIGTLVVLERDEILSRLGRTQPGRIDLNMRLFSQVFVYALLPLLLLVARAVPSFGDYLFRWFAPLSGLLQ